jgi:hypothetical protein
MKEAFFAAENSESTEKRFRRENAEIRSAKYFSVFSVVELVPELRGRREWQPCS